MNRRQVLRYGAIGATVSAFAGPLAPDAAAATITIDLTIEPVDAEMIDGQIVYQLVYFGGPSGPDTPRPVLTVKEGDIINVRVTNNAPEPHGFVVSAIPQSRINSIAPGQTGVCSFVAPVGGTYIYSDPLNDPVYRVVGLHGAFVVAPKNGTTPQGWATPYSRLSQSTAVRQLFNALGNPTGRFPGQRWDPNDPARTKIWIFNQVDPALNAAVAAGQYVDPATLKFNFVPRYFTLNGLSGFDASHDETIQPIGYIGQPCLIRTLNVGLATHSPHIHGNHVMEMSHSGPNAPVVVEANIYEIDTWLLKPMYRTDVLLPFEVPPSIPVWPPVQEPFPLRYVMHCHNEPSQTAAGGNYPQGIVTHWEILGPTIPTVA